jgi:hypothetical protein
MIGNEQKSLEHCIEVCCNVDVGRPSSVYVYRSLSRHGGITEGIGL